MTTMTERTHAHIPYAFLRDNLSLILERRINPEIFLPADVLDTLIPEELAAIAEALARDDRPCTIHGPFMDLNPGSAEPLLRKTTLHRFHQALDAAAILKPRVMVLHPGYDKWRYGSAQELWLKNSIESWREVEERARTIGCVIAVENIFEEEPGTLRALLDEIDSPWLRHCFDVGHWNLFARVGLEEWFAELGGYVAETHIHDNNGQRDDHAALGEGNIDFNLFFTLLKRDAPQAVRTIEAHSREALERALVSVQRYR